MAPTGAPLGAAPLNDEATMAALDDLVAHRRILVCCGSGGVGKTTTAAVLAMRAAELGRRAVVVTIDPARRLADALGLDGLTDAPAPIDPAAAGSGDVAWSGELWAMMLDTKSTFDGLVGKYAADEEQHRRILGNRFYQNISSALSGTQEYMAMEKLYELAEESDFDLVVVDTPPTRNALDFIDAPRRLSRFLDHRLYKIITAPNRGLLKAVNVATQTFVRSLARVVGADVIDDAVAFFQAFDGMEEGFKNRAGRVEALLREDECAFVLVASPRRDTVGEATFFAEKLDEAGIDVRALIVNRMHPRFPTGEGMDLAEATRERAESLAAGTGSASVDDARPIADAFRNLADFQLVASREEDHLADLTAQVEPAPVLRVPFLRSDVHDLDGLRAIGAALHG